MHSPAYFAPGVKADVARDIPAFRRILPAGPWQVLGFNHPTLGWGALAWWADCPQPEGEAWRESPDGLWYLPPTQLPSQADLAKPNSPAGIVVSLSGGQAVTMPLAAIAPRKLSLTTGTAGAPADEYGLRAAAVHSRLTGAGKDGLPLLDPDVLAMIAAGLALAYRVTTELLDDLGWLTTADIDPLLCAGLGHDPKASAPGATPSQSPALG